MVATHILGCIADYVLYCLWQAAIWHYVIYIRSITAFSPYYMPYTLGFIQRSRAKRTGCALSVSNWHLAPQLLTQAASFRYDYLGTDTRELHVLLKCKLIYLMNSKKYTTICYLLWRHNFIIFSS